MSRMKATTWQLHGQTDLKPRRRTMDSQEAACRMAKYPILSCGDEAGFAELTPEQGWMMKAIGALRRRWSPGAARSSGGDAL
jgi:hypothetical protein